MTLLRSFIILFYRSSLVLFPAVLFSGCVVTVGDHVHSGRVESEVLPHDEQLRYPSIEVPQRVDFLLYTADYLAKHRQTILKSLERREPYYPLLKRAFSERGLPLDLMNVALIESNYKPEAKSPSGAVGMWQFIASTARQYGLEVGWLRDDRTDVYKSTHAAARHLEDLYNKFDDWYLAIAAYNGGVTGVKRAIRRAGSRDFFEISRQGFLRKETRSYVKKVLAVTAILRNPEEFGLWVSSQSRKELSHGRENGMYSLRPFLGMSES